MKYFLIILLVLTACSTVELDGVEVREYNGTKLDSINNFRENSIKGVQYINIDEYTLKISGLVESPREMTYEEVLQNQIYKKAVTLYCVEGWDATILWEGILIKDLINPLPEAKTIIFKAYDGYSTSFPIEYVMDNDIIMAHKMNGVEIPAERGYPFQLVAESKWGYKWIKWITEIEVSDTDYIGYWEQRGYSHTGDLNESFYS